MNNISKYTDKEVAYAVSRLTDAEYTVLKRASINMYSVTVAEAAALHDILEHHVMEWRKSNKWWV